MKIEKIIAEISKTKKRILDMQTKLRELERMKTEKENAEIVELVRSIDVPAPELTEMLRTIREKALAEAIKSQVPEFIGKREDNYNGE